MQSYKERSKACSACSRTVPSKGGTAPLERGFFGTSCGFHHVMSVSIVIAALLIPH